MKLKTIFPILLMGVMLLGIPACKKNERNHISVKLMAIADKINAAPDTVLANGMTLTGCSIDPKASLFIYHLTVPDKRFNVLTTDSLKHIFADELKAENKHGFLKILRENSLGVKYVCTLPDTTLSIEFPPSEIEMFKSDKNDIR